MPEEVRQIKEKILPILREAGVLKSSVFGSVARGEAGPDSDVDILIEAPAGMGYFKLFDLKTKLEMALDKKVDLGTYASVKPFLKQQILSQQIQIL